MEKNIEDSIKDGLIMTIGTSGIFFGLKVANVKPPKASLDAMDMLKITGGRRGGERLCSLQKMDQRVMQQQNFITLYTAIKLHDTDKESVCFVLLILEP